MLEDIPTHKEFQIFTDHQAAEIQRLKGELEEARELLDHFALAAKAHVSLIESLRYRGIGTKESEPVLKELRSLIKDKEGHLSSSGK